MSERMVGADGWLMVSAESSGESNLAVYTGQRQ